MRKPARNPATARSFTAVVHRDGDAYVASCPELDVVSQGRTVEAATANLKEAVELFLDCAVAKEVRRRLRDKVVVTRFETVRG